MAKRESGGTRVKLGPLVHGGLGRGGVPIVYGRSSLLIHLPYEDFFVKIILHEHV